MTKRILRFLCVLPTLAGGVALLLPAVGANRACAGEKDERPFHLAEVRINRYYGFFGPDKTDKLFFKPGHETVKGKNPGKIEVSVQRAWYSHKLVLEFQAPELVRDGESVLLKGTAAADWDLKLKEPSASLGFGVGLGFRYQEKGGRKDLAGTPTNPIRAGKYSLKAETSDPVKVIPGDTPFGGGGNERNFHVVARSEIAGSQAGIEVYVVYRRDDKKPAPIVVKKSDVQPSNLVKVPSVKGLSAAKAKLVLEQAGLKPSFELGQQAPSKEQSLLAYQERPAAGTSLAKGSETTVTLYAPAEEAAIKPPVSEVIKPPVVEAIKPPVVKPPVTTKTFTAQDAQRALLMSVQLIPMDLELDVDGNGRVNSDDARAILRRARVGVQKQK